VAQAEACGQRGPATDPRRDDSPVLVRVTPSFLETVIAQSSPPGFARFVTWREPDANGVYTPMVTQVKCDG